MFCYQCEETAKGTGCTVKGVCGKEAATAGLMDVLIYLCKGISVRNTAAMAAGKGNKDAGMFIAEALFATLTNTNFDETRLRSLIMQAVAIRNALPSVAGEPDACTGKFGNDAEIAAKAEQIAAAATTNNDVNSLRALLLFGLKGVAAYYHHAAVLGYTDNKIEDFLQKGLASTLQDLPAGEMTALVLECGGIGVTTLALLDTANTKTYGNPEITSVKTNVRKRPGILVTGHDLKDLEQLLEQSKDSGIDIYTHGEMLPGNAYPALKKYAHLYGNYGSSWWHQKEEFEKFNGPLLITTNCIVPPKDSYKDRIYTTGPAGFPGVKHIAAGKDGEKDFSEVIAHAKKSQPPQDLQAPGRNVITGCAHEAVLALSGTVVEAVKKDDIKRFVVMAGCDGRQSERSYYTEFAKALPKNTIILTAGCAKYRYNGLDLGAIGGIPRVIDAGQCNDCYSLVVIAQALAKAFGVGINELPVSYNIAWYEQKAALVLLALLNLGVKDITLGPKLPAFVSPGVLNVLVENFGIKKNTTVEADLVRMVPAELDRGDIHIIPHARTHNRGTNMTDRENSTSENPDKKREDLVGKVLVTNNLVQYQDGTVASRMIVFKKTGTITLFAFDAGEGLSEHSAPFDATLTVTDGEAEVSIAGKPFTVRTGDMIILPANIPHGVQAKQRFKMTLTMIRE